MKPQPITFSEWKNLIPKISKSLCPDCSGLGEKKCDCCGNYSQCDTCHGEGNLFNGRAPRDIYVEQVERESALYRQWMESIGRTEKAIERELK